MRKVGLVLAGVLVLAAITPVAFGAGTTGPSVSVKIRTLTKTLLKPTTEHGEKGWITKGGTPSGKCSGDSAVGALDLATHGHWKGKYYSSVGSTFVTSILGVKPKGSDFWELVVNGKVSNKGACDVKLKKGEQILFKIAK